MKRATDQYREIFRDYAISIHALCEEGDTSDHCPDLCCNWISIHALCEEGDVKYITYAGGTISISIHALCEEGDL